MRTSILSLFSSCLDPTENPAGDTETLQNCGFTSWKGPSPPSHCSGEGHLTSVVNCWDLGHYSSVPMLANWEVQYMGEQKLLFLVKAEKILSKNVKRPENKFEVYTTRSRAPITLQDHSCLRFWTWILQLVLDVEGLGCSHQEPWYCCLPQQNGDCVIAASPFSAEWVSGRSSEPSHIFGPSHNRSLRMWVSSTLGETQTHWAENSQT